MDTKVELVEAQKVLLTAKKSLQPMVKDSKRLLSKMVNGQDQWEHLEKFYLIMITE